ncbi:MAG: sulfotransferase family 2 domain-containing protein [Bacteroidota bacterium]
MNGVLHKIIYNRLTIPLTPFYQKYPYHNGISINSADSRGCISKQLGFFCNRIPKAANSTIVENLALWSFGHEIPSKKAKLQFTTPSQLTQDEVNELQEMYSFAIVRNPFTRTLSAYLDKVERRALKKNKETSFFDFLQNLDNGKLYSNAHWAPQHSLLLLPLEKFNFIGNVESLDNDLRHIQSHIIGSRNGREMKSFKTNATGARKKIKQYYDDRNASIVLELFKKDFEIFGYSHNLPI